MASKKLCQFCQLDFKSRAFGLQHPQSNLESIHLDPPTENQDVNDDQESEEDQDVNDDQESEEDQDGNDDQKSEENQDINNDQESEEYQDVDDIILKHKATHVPGSFMCNYCSKVFKKKDLFKNHILIHIGRKNFKCNMCNKKYSTKRALNAHRKLKHNDSS